MEQANRRQHEQPAAVKPDRLGVGDAGPAELELEAEAEQESEDGVEFAVDEKGEGLLECPVERRPGFGRKRSEAPQAISDQHSEHGEAAKHVESDDPLAGQGRPVRRCLHIPPHPFGRAGGTALAESAGNRERYQRPRSASRRTGFAAKTAQENLFSERRRAAKSYKPKRERRGRGRVFGHSPTKPIWK